ncbi:MAG: hypothetical protein AABY53_05940 [Bdellovibrionota bacterium]
MKSFIRVQLSPLLGILFSIISLNAYAAQSLSPKISGPYSSIRTLGMGNAFTAVADDYSLIMYNPAGFARKKHNEIQLSLLGAGVSAKTLTVASDIQKASDTVGTDAQKAQAISEVLEKYYGQSLGGKVQALEFFWVRNGWGVALLPLDLTIDMSIHKQLGPALDLNVKGDTTMAFGYGREIMKNVDAGITFKYLHRVSVEEVVPAFELATDPNVLSDKRFREGTKLDFDLGFMWRPNWFNSSTTSQTTEIEPVKVETTSPAPEEPKAEVSEEPKKEEVKTEEKKTEEIKATEERKPQAEEAAGTKDAKATVDETKPEAKLAEGPAAAADVVAPVEIKEEDKVAEEKKSEESKKEETKTVETSVPESDERFPLTLGFVVHNVIGGEFALSKIANKLATEVPAKQHRVIDVGSQYMLRDGEDFKIRYMLDFHNILHPEITLNKSFHTGIEMDYSPNTWFKTQLRAGINQMYFTAGASFLLGIINLDFATYGEEVGSANTKIENRVMALKLGFNF